MAIHLNSSVTELSGIGVKAYNDFRNMGITSVRDLLWYVPFRYDDYSKVADIGSVKHGDTVTIHGTITSIKTRPGKNRKLKITEAIVEDETGEIKIIWFNQSYFVKTLPIGTRRAFAGRVDNRFGISLVNPVQEPVGRNVHTGRIVPIYGLSGSLKMRRLRDAIKEALLASKEFVDWLPKEIMKKEKFPSLPMAISSVHFPESQAALERGVDRLKFDELFLHQMLFAEIRYDREKKNADVIEIDKDILKTFVAQLPFELTSAQKRSAWEIVQDLSKETPMNRLLEGDVGSGKTIVAAMAINSAIKKDKTVVYLAPTEILASQQFETLRSLLKNHDVGLLSRSKTMIGNDEVKRDELVEKVESEKLRCIVGTHSLLQGSIDFPRLSFVVIDEQHRFGVEQRHALLDREEGRAPHLLSMTATPIPRSLALTLYGDLDLSILDEMPKGRLPVGTAVVPENQKTAMWEHVETEIVNGSQIFVVCPLIDPSDKMGAKSVSEVEKILKKGPLKNRKISVLHGRMKADEKTKTIESFQKGKIDILVSTTVVEVGVDIPNATVMVIYGAERFGLAQLHQLRGRVGRSDVRSYCYLLTDSTTEKSGARLQAVVDSQDGFDLAEKDLELRGAGNVFGSAQSGFPDFKLATPADSELMKKARDWASELLFDSEFVNNHPLVRQRVRQSLDKVHLE
jgi:ATP-dependent DNA helicase RecG